MRNSIDYIGNELELFSQALNWKRYYGQKLKKYIHGDVLEAGAGIGETTIHLFNPSVSSWTCLEPDGRLLEEVKNKIKSERLPSICKPIQGTSIDILEKRKRTGSSEVTFADITIPVHFDSILYIDVIEHIERDGEELLRAKELLRPGGHLIILVPAHQWLYSPFDKAIGHFRRYNKKRLCSVIPVGMKQEQLCYLDSMGLFASLTNKLLLRKDYPTLKQVKFWDRLIVPLSRSLDPLLFHSAGKTLIGVWTRE
jgi:SAM-dependent methyltransferase